MLEWSSLLLLTRSPFLVLLSWEKWKGKVSKVEINYSLSSSLLLYCKLLLLRRGIRVRLAPLLLSSSSFL
eukprot:10437.XXX_569746_569955_1 [CDS] Oithona nana genome sequencing.